MNTEEILKKLLEGQQKIDKKLSSIESTVRDIKNQQEKNTKRLEGVFEQTAGLSEFRTEVNEKLDEIKEDIEFLTQKETKNEKDIFKLKKKAQ